MGDAPERSFLTALHHQVCFENGDHPDEVDTPYSIAADAITRADLSDAKDARIAELERMKSELVADKINLRSELASVKGLNAELVAALERVGELNTGPADKNGHRWDISDLIGQEVLFSPAKAKADAPAQNMRVKPLTWYGKPEGQDVRIGRCDQIAYSVSYRMGNWGYARQGDVGHIISFKGGRNFRSEADAIDGADVDHEDRIRSALEPADPLDDPRVKALVGAGEAMIAFHNGPAEARRPDIWQRLLQRFAAALAALEADT